MTVIDYNEVYSQIINAKAQKITKREAKGNGVAPYGSPCTIDANGRAVAVSTPSAPEFVGFLHPATGVAYNLTVPPSLDEEVVLVDGREGILNVRVAHTAALPINSKLTTNGVNYLTDYATAIANSALGIRTFRLLEPLTNSGSEVQILPVEVE